MRPSNELAHLLRDAFEAEAHMRATRLQLLLFVEWKPEEVMADLNALPPEFEQHSSLLKELRAAAVTKGCAEYLKIMFPMRKGVAQS
jgi:hypothetical protein